RRAGKEAHSAYAARARGISRGSIRKRTPNGHGVSRRDASTCQESVRPDGREIWPDAGVLSPRPGYTTKTLRVTDRVHLHARERVDQWHRVARVSAHGRTRGSRSPGRS